jgi:hypothetical protein
MKGQATIEYLVLLSVAIIIALVIFGFMGWIPGMAGSMRERQSRMYWSSTYPLAIKDYKGTSGGLVLLIQNVGDSKIIITEIRAGGNTTTITGSYQLLPGEQKQYTASQTVCGPVGSTFEFSNVSIKYDVVDGISGNVLAGDRPLIGKCAS